MYHHFTKTFFRLDRLVFSILLIVVTFLGYTVTESGVPMHGNVLGASTVQKPYPFIASIDTMKDSRDSETWHLTPAQITNDVNITALLHVNYITVDTHWDYPTYMAEWIAAIRASGKKVWFRSAPNQWEESNNIKGIMTPNALLANEKAFILAHPTFFQPGDIFDPCPEPEQGHYWESTYGNKWTWTAPNKATADFNTFIRNSTDVANAAFSQLHIHGVITNVRSTNSFFATHPLVLEAKTVQKLGLITVDSYPEENTLIPSVATKARVDELNQIENIWHVPIVIGELGYSNSINVDDFTQEKVLTSEFQAIQKLTYIQGLNYWVGAGSSQSGGFTHLYEKNDLGIWSLRPAALDLSSYFKQMTNSNI